MKRLVCPPYDVINDSLARQLRKNKQNAVHVELPQGTDDLKYARARKVWKKWTAGNVLRRDSQPAFYIYEQVFTSGNRNFSRRGFFCELKVEKPGAGSVLRHELTISGPKLDRLKLLRALRANTSPIFGLFADRRGNVRSILSGYSKKKETFRFVGPDKVLHRLWLCTDRRQCEVIMATMRREPVAIAYGHHRYETAWNYAQESVAVGARKALFFLCPAGDKGLVVFPTHRILKAGTLSGLLDRAEKMKSVFTLREVTGPKLQWRTFLLTDGKKFFKVAPRTSAALKSHMPGKPDVYRNLALAQVHSLLVPEKKKEDFIYSHDLRETLALARKIKTCAILVPPVSVDELYNVVRAGELMPQKSTYFIPKVTTGIVFRSLD